MKAKMRMDAEMPAKMTATWCFPDDVRVERVMKMTDRVMALELGI